MKIGIDAHVLGKKLGGVERFIAELVKQLPQLTPEHEYVIFVTKEAFSNYKLQSNQQVQYVPLVFSNPLIERLILLPWLVKKHKLNALMVQRLAPWFCGKCKLIVTIHDLTPIKFADAYKGLSNKLVRLLTKNSILRADLILTPTNAIKAEIEHYAPTVTAPIHAFYNGVDAAAFNKKSETIENKTSENKAPYLLTPYLLTVGAIERRKNIEVILDMMTRLKDASIKLYILGGIRDQAYFDALQTQIKQLNLTERVQYLGFQDEAALIQRYQQAAIFITASKDEGFNIPPLEAMACNVPVICSDIPVHQELFSDAALFFAVHSAQELSAQELSAQELSAQELGEKVESILQNTALSQALILKGKAKVLQFSWRNTAVNVGKAFKEIS